MHKYVVYSFFIISFFCMFYVLKNNATIQTMQYFPIDEHAFIYDATTDITKTPNADVIEWSIASTSSEIAYLRQDVSLLYVNGKYKGVQNKWKQHLEHLELTKRFKQPDSSSLLQAISFHHGEIHYPDNQIFSVQKMTSNQLYFIKENKIVHSFQRPSNSHEKKLEKKLNEITEQQLAKHWNKLIHHFNIREEEYDSFPLTELVQYEQNTLPGRTESDSKKIIGQLWEGLYKNYILLLKEGKNQQSQHFVPLIMISKNNDHLLVIFELGNQPQKLIQKLS